MEKAIVGSGAERQLNPSKKTRERFLPNTREQPTQTNRRRRRSNTTELAAMSPNDDGSGACISNWRLSSGRLCWNR